MRRRSLQDGDSPATFLVSENLVQKASVPRIERNRNHNLFTVVIVQVPADRLYRKKDVSTVARAL